MKKAVAQKDSRSPNLGTALVDRSLLRALSTLWDGPLVIRDLPLIEQAVRAILTSQTLVVARPLQTLYEQLSFTTDPFEYEQPFNDHLLDYEFIDPANAHPCESLGEDESSALANLVSSELAKLALAALPKSLDTGAKVNAFWEAWYIGLPEEECKFLAETVGDVGNEHVALDTVLTCHWILGHRPTTHAKYLVGAHRAGLTVYADSPLSRICQRHLFSEWPERLYSKLDEDFRAAARQLRGPSIGIELPPLTALLLSRARNRSDIPYKLRDMRAEYEQARNSLWALMAEMWFSPDFSEQMKILSSLQKAAWSLFPAAFPERFDTLGFALSASIPSLSSVANVGHRLLEHNKPRARVAAISFTDKLASDMKRHLQSTVALLRKHLSPSELREFGADPR